MEENCVRFRINFAIVRFRLENLTFGNFRLFYIEDELNDQRFELFKHYNLRLTRFE